MRIAIVTVLVLSSVGIAPRVDAAEYRFSGANCFMDHLSSNEPDAYMTEVGIENFDSTDPASWLNLECPVFSGVDGYFPDQFSTVNIHVYDGSPTASVYTWACTTYWNLRGAGRACSPLFESGDEFQGRRSFQLGAVFAGLGSRADFPYLTIELPASVDAAEASSFQGYFLRTP